MIMQQLPLGVRLQDRATFEVVGHRAVAQIDAVVVEQAVLARHLQVIGSGHRWGWIRRWPPDPRAGT